MNNKLFIFMVIIITLSTALAAWTAGDDNRAQASGLPALSGTAGETFSVPASGTGDPAAAPAGVGNVPVNTGFQWAAINLAESYQIQLSDNLSFANPIDDRVSNPIWDPDQNLSYGTTYFWRIKPFSSDNISGDWTYYTFTTRTQAESAAQFISSCNNATTAPSGIWDVPVNTAFQWSVVSKASHYEIQLADNPDFTNPINATMDINIWVPNQVLNYGTTYFWKVRGVSGSIYSNWDYNTFTTMTSSATPAASPTATATSPATVSPTP